MKNIPPPHPIFVNFMEFTRFLCWQIKLLNIVVQIKIFAGNVAAILLKSYLKNLTFLRFRIN